MIQKLFCLLWAMLVLNTSIQSAPSSKACISYCKEVDPCLYNCQLAHLETHHQCWKSGFRGHVLPPTRCLSIFHQYNDKSASITSKWFHSSRVLGAELSRLQSRPFINLMHHETKNMTQKTQNFWAARIVYMTNMGRHSCPKSASVGLLSSQTKKRGFYTAVNMGLSQHVADIKCGTRFLLQVCEICKSVADMLTFTFSQTHHILLTSNNFPHLSRPSLRC